MNLKINNLDIYKGEGELFLSNGDHYLLKINGEDSIILESLLQQFKETNSVENAFSNLKDKFERDHFDNFISWLLSNGVLREEGNELLEKKYYHKNIIVWGDFKSEDEVSDKILQKINSDSLKYSLKSLIYNDFDESRLEGCDLLIVFSPIFGNYNAFQKLNELCYKLEIPMLHIGTGMNFVTIGPFSVPSMKTPCLSCYSKRKMINLDNRGKYLEFIKLSNGKIIGGNDLFENRYFGSMIEFLKVELENFFLRRSMYLFSRSISIDFLSYEMSESKVLRIPHCEVCNESAVIAPLN